jgi:putative nucleotidyltransferase with HDIG domain
VGHPSLGPGGDHPRFAAPCSLVTIEPDIADVSGATRYARPRSAMRERVAMVLCWAFLVVAVVDGPMGFDPFRSAGVALLGLLTGVGLQLTFEQVGGRLRRRREQVAIFAWLSASVVVLRICSWWVPLPSTWIPTAALLVPVALQLGRSGAIPCALVLAVVAGTMVAPFDPVLALMVASQGLAIAFLIPKRRKGGWRWIRAPLLGSVVATPLGYLAAQLLVHGGLDPLDLVSIEWGRLSWAAIAGLGWPIVGVALDPLFEAAVGNLSRSTLLELSDLNNPVLQRISTRAPGTWAHSRTMANLAESAAHAVDADALLIRVGAYYHDLGKADEPQYFVENVPRGRISPHDGLTPEQSAAKIIHHVRSSVVRGRQAGLPEPIIDFMHTHHGSTRVEFFYQRARTRAVEAGEDPDQVIDAGAFTYPGAKPDTPETGILMIVDSVEAASRTLERPERKQVDALLRQIVFAKLGAQQLDDCGLSLRELRRIIENLVDTLLASAHDRIAYPWQQEEKAAARAEAGVTEPSGTTPVAPAKSEPGLRVIEP